MVSYQTKISRLSEDAVRLQFTGLSEDGVHLTNGEFYARLGSDDSFIKTLSQALMLGARNLKGVELVLNNEVHPYDLLRYERAIFSKAAIEQLTESLVKSVSKRSAAQTEAA